MLHADKTLDVKGLVSPRPEILAQKTLAAMTAGQVLTVITTDPAARQKLPPVCERIGCRVLGFTEERGTLYFQILKQGPPNGGGPSPP